jgi:Protein of unknown function (DUF1579)
MNVRKWLFAWITAGVVISPATGLAQEDKAQKEGMRQDLPGPIHKRLGELAGTWDVSVRFILGDKQQEGKATCEANLILGGRFLQQEYSSKLRGQPFHVLQILGYDNARKKSIEIMLDNLGTSVLHNEGTVSDDGNVFTNSGEPLDPQTGKPYKLRTVTTIIDHDNFTLEWFRVDDAGKLAKVVSMSHTRKKKDQ